METIIYVLTHSVMLGAIGFLIYAVTGVEKRELYLLEAVPAKEKPLNANKLSKIPKQALSRAFKQAKGDFSPESALAYLAPKPVL